MNQSTQPSNKIEGQEIHDGKRDIYISLEAPVQGQEPTPSLFISEHLYTSVGFTYEEMKTKEGLGKFLSAYGLFVLSTAGFNELFDLPRLVGDYRKLKDLAEYFVSRCEGTNTEHGPIRSVKAYNKFKEVLDAIKAAAPQDIKNPTSPDNLS